MNCNSTIYVHELLSTSIQTREASSVLMKVIENDPCDYIELDFSSVVFISRAFADQFHSDKMNCTATYNKTIIVANANEEVINMFQTVAKTQNSNVRKMEDLPVYKYSSQAYLESFLLNF